MDSNLNYKVVSITGQHLAAATWTEIVPGTGVAKTVIRASGGYRLASSAVPGTDFMVLPSGTAFEHLGEDSIYVYSTLAASLQLAKYS